MFKRLGINLLTILAAGFGTIWIAGWALSRPVQNPIGAPPADLAAKVVEITTERGAVVKAWWCPQPGANATVLLLPGIRANRLSMMGRARFLRRAGYSVLLLDFEGTGETQGAHITFGWRERQDVIAAVDFVRGKSPSDRVAIIGSSLGGAAALLATPPLKVDALILEAVYPTIETATNNRLTKYLGPVGKAAGPLLLSQLSLRLGIPARNLRPLDHIARVGCPLLILNGQDDPNTTVRDARALYDLAPDPKELWIVPHAGHVDLHRAEPEEYERRVLAFFDRTLRETTPERPFSGIRL